MARHIVDQSKLTFQGPLVKKFHASIKTAATGVGVILWSNNRQAIFLAIILPFFLDLYLHLQFVAGLIGQKRFYLYASFSSVQLTVTVQLQDLGIRAICCHTETDISYHELEKLKNALIKCFVRVAVNQFS